MSLCCGDRPAGNVALRLVVAQRLEGSVLPAFQRWETCLFRSKMKETDSSSALRGIE